VSRPALPDALARRLQLLRPLAADGVDALREHWRAHALTLAGIVWGAAAVVLLVSMGAGFHAFLDFSVDKTGDRWSNVQGQYTTSASGGLRPGRPVRLTDDDLARVSQAPGARRVGANLTELFAAVETPYRTRGTAVQATTSNLFTMKGHAMARGRWYDEAEDRAGRHVAVLGAALVPVFFGGDDPLGRTLQIEGVPFEVIGVLERKGLQFFIYGDLHDNTVWIPLRAGQRLFGPSDRVDRIFFEPERLADEAALHASVRRILAHAHHFDPDDGEALFLESVPQRVQPIRNVTVALHVLLGIVGTVTLAMAGVGVANLMIALVNGRRTELAMRRACGARRGDLTLQLLVETVVVVLAGGVAGVVLGVGVALGIGALPLPEHFPAPAVTPSVVVTTFAVLVATGLVAGVAPARLASRVDPSTALRVP
jgi:putative ABC transport system permease protein